MFDYKQRPFVKTLTDEQYNRATGRLADSLPKSPSGHECNGTYKTFAAAHCPYCQPKDAYPQVL